MVEVPKWDSQSLWTWDDAFLAHVSKEKEYIGLGVSDLIKDRIVALGIVIV